jgi:hypothetical protein
MLRGFRRHVRSECHRDCHLHGVFTAFAAYFREMPVIIKVVWNVAVEMTVSFAGGTGFKALAGDPPTDITIHKYDFFPIQAMMWSVLLTFRNCISNTVAAR